MTAPASFPIENSVALVTGTGKPNGIGANVVRALLERGAAKVYATARDASQLDFLVRELGSDKVVPVSLDVTDLEAIQELPAKHPDVNLIVNNAGYFGWNSSLQSVDQARTEYEVNYLAPLALVQSYGPTLLALASDGKASAVVNVNSIASLVNFPAGGTYSASKAAAHSLTQAQRRDLPGSLVVGVYPGPVDTDMAKDLEGMPKASPRSVADEIVAALAGGTEDVYPDPVASQMYEGWRADAKAVEKQMAASVAA
jgi:NAD(P)-dependent dehydrogenase (short-subunit alcohol dehydrogenase family)